MKIRFWVLFCLITAFYRNAVASPFGLYTFTESDIVLKTSTGDIDGSLLFPKTYSKPELVIIIAGSGPTDRDCNSPGVNTNAYKLLAEELAMNGTASVRYDKRLIGKSQIAGMKENDIRFENYIDDAVDWVKMMRKDNRFSKIYIIGHSEGSLIGMVTASKVNVDGFISLAGAGRPADQLIMEQIKDQPEAVKDETKSILASLRNGNMVFGVSSYLESLFRTNVQPYMISWIKFDPAKEIAKVKAPVLILQGSNDIQISIQDAKILSSAKPEAKLVIIDRMNHILKDSDSDRDKNLATYSNPELPVKQEMINEIIKFVQ